MFISRPLHPSLSFWFVMVIGFLLVFPDSPPLLQWGWLSVAKFLVRNWGDIVDSRIGLSYHPPDFLGWRAGQYDNPMRVNYNLSHGLRILPMIVMLSFLKYVWSCFMDLR
jgi:hypothetical protein